MPMATLLQSSCFSSLLKLNSTLMFQFFSQYFTMNKLNQTQMCLIQYSRIVLVLNENINVLSFTKSPDPFRTCIYLFPPSVPIVLVSLREQLPRPVFFSKASSPSNKLTSENPVCCGFHRDDGSLALYSLFTFATDLPPAALVILKGHSNESFQM